MLSRITATSALTVYIPPAIYAAGNSIEGEVAIDFRQLQEENIEEVQVRLRGTSRTVIHRDKTTLHETIRLAHDDASLWTRGSAYPSPGSDMLRVPFKFTLPESLPPSFHYQTLFQSANVRYALTAVGVRKGILGWNKRHRMPLAVLPSDELGASLRADASATRGWRTFAKEDSIRRGLWGEYAKVHVELSLPDIPVLPLFADIPYAVSVRTTTPPQPHGKAKAAEHSDPSKPAFPPVPRSADGLEFALHRRVKLRAKAFRGSTSGDVATFLGGGGGKKTADAPVIEEELPEKEWVPVESAALIVDGSEKSEKGLGLGMGGADVDQDPDTKGSWVQRATFRSTFRLNCPPTFAVHNVECNYELVLRVPFPGIGNSLKLEVPVKVTSGIDRPFARDEAADLPPPLDLPPAYWDENSGDWDADEKE